MFESGVVSGSSVSYKGVSTHSDMVKSVRRSSRGLMVSFGWVTAEVELVIMVRYHEDRT